jgi:hydroxymethylpyrimidine pyrophosphatase-like HAD family hydrolase
MSKQKIIAFDLDDVLCHRSNQFENLGPLKYSYCIPNKKMIELVNSLYDDGHKIVIYTARGMTQFNGNVIEIYGQLYTKTLKNLDEWGLKYHQLAMGKIHYDVLIDDKVLNSLNITKDSITQFLYGK